MNVRLYRRQKVHLSIIIKVELIIPFNDKKKGMIELDNDKIERIAARKVEEIVDDSIILKNVY